MLNDILAAISDCVWAIDNQTGELLFINPAVENIFGYTADEFRQNPKLRELLIDPLEQINTESAKQTSENSDWARPVYRTITKSGDFKWISYQKRMVNDEASGRSISLSVIREVDFTEKMNTTQTGKNAADEIAWTKNNLEALINATEDLTWSIDRHGRYVYMNSAYRRQISNNIGIVPNEGDDAYSHSGSTEKVRNEWRSYYNRALSGERFVTRHDSRHPKTKQIRHFEVSFNPIYRDSKEEIIGVGCFARDVTTILNTEEALIKQNERLRNIASLSSHELRRPVASMLGLINIIDRENFNNPDNAQIIEHMFTVTNEIDEVIRLIVNKTFIDHKSYL